MERRAFLKGLAGIAAGFLAGGCVEPAPKFKPKPKPKKRQAPKGARKKPLQQPRKEIWYCENDHEFLYGQAQYDLHRALHPTHVIVKVSG